MLRRRTVSFEISSRSRRRLGLGSMILAVGMFGLISPAGATVFCECTGRTCEFSFPNLGNCAVIPSNRRIFLTSSCIDETSERALPWLETSTGSRVNGAWKRADTPYMFEFVGVLPENQEILVRSFVPQACSIAMTGDFCLAPSCAPASSGLDDCCAFHARAGFDFGALGHDQHDRNDGEGGAGGEGNDSTAPLTYLRFFTGSSDVVAPPMPELQVRCAKEEGGPARILPAIAPQDLSDVREFRIEALGLDPTSASSYGGPCVTGAVRRFSDFYFAPVTTPGVYTLVPSAVDWSGNVTTGPSVSVRVPEDCGPPEALPVLEDECEEDTFPIEPSCAAPPDTRATVPNMCAFAIRPPSEPEVDRDIDIVDRPPEPESGIEFDRASGGAGCACSAAPSPSSSLPFGLAWMLGLVVIGRRRLGAPLHSQSVTHPPRRAGDRCLPTTSKL